MICNRCGRWHDTTGQPLVGWQSVHNSKIWTLPEGHRPPDQHHIDVATGWEPLHGTCTEKSAR